MIPVGERHFRRALAEFVAHYHRERNHQGLDNELIAVTPARDTGATYLDVRDWVDCLTITNGPRDHRVGRDVEHYAVSRLLPEIRDVRRHRGGAVIAERHLDDDRRDADDDAESRRTVVRVVGLFVDLK